jgi:hypothetical protein
VNLSGHSVQRAMWDEGYLRWRKWLIIQCKCVAVQNYRDICTSEGGSSEHWWRSSYSHPIRSLNGPTHWRVNYLIFSDSHMPLSPSLLGCWVVPWPVLFFKFCLVKYVSSNQEVGLKEVWTICGGVICRKYSRYEAQVKARHNLSAS